MVKFVHKERIAEGSTRRFLDGRRNDAPLRKGMVAKFRESHHMIAKLFAAGLKGKEIAERTGYTEHWLSQLHNDPAFQELLSKYRDLDTQLFLEGRQEFYAMANPLLMQTMRHTREHFNQADDEGELIPLNYSVKVMAEMADRLGYAKHKVSINANVDFADALQRAIKRSGKAIDGTLNEGFGGMKTISSSELLAPAGPSNPVPQAGLEPSLAPEETPVSGERMDLERSYGRKHSDVHASDTGHHSSLGSAGGSGFPARSVEASQREMVLPGAVESRPLRRRLLG